MTYEIAPSPPRGGSLPAALARRRRPLRAWQQAAAAAVFDHAGEAFLASATPAAGKTTFGLHVAHRMLAEGRVARVAVVAPTTHICRQWALDAARYGIALEPNRPNAAGPEPRDRHGVAVTYATVAAGAAVHRRRCAERPTLLIADEPHHMGEDATWGRSTVDAFARARFRLLLSGTPFRSDNAPIPWVAYDEDGISRADYGYGYTQALVDGVCRPVTFHTYGGDMEWVSDGRVRSADFDVVLPAAEAARRLRTALDPDGDWIAHVLRDAHDQLVRAPRRRASATPAALVVAIDKEHAEKLADRLARITGERPDVVHSDAADASARIARFAAGSAPWLVSVLMVSEGVDVPRLRVGVYATTARTELFFRQVIGRFIRRTPAPKDQMSHVFLPSDPKLKELAAQIEEERNHALVLEPAGDETVASAASGRRPARRSARCGRARAATRTCCRRPSPATRCSCSPSPPRRRSRRSRPPPRRRPSRRARSSAASACAPSATRWSRRSPAAPASRTARSTRASIARSAPRRSTSRPTTSSSSANRLLEREIARRR